MITTSNNTHGKVTGASSGIGAATARAPAANGFRVALLARRLDRISTLADELGNGSIAIEGDVTDRDSIVAAADRVRQELGNADVLVLGPFDSDQREDYRQMIEVNLLGAITATEVFLDQVKDGGGVIINISSVAGPTARPGNGVYAATKWGINGWSESLRQDLLPDVRVTLVEPGVVAFYVRVLGRVVTVDEDDVIPLRGGWRYPSDRISKLKRSKHSSRLRINCPGKHTSPAPEPDACV